MRTWEYVTLIFNGYPYCPEGIHIWPSGVLDLNWLAERFGVRIRIRDAEGIDSIDKLYKKAPQVSADLIRTLGLQGWEAVAYSKGNEYDRSYRMLFKRPVTDSESEA